MSLSGHDAAWAEWRAALNSARLHHAWLLAGPRGIGKGAFARAAAAELVGQGGDIFLLDHLPANETEEEKKAEGKPFQTKRNITIEQVRQLQPRLTKTLDPGQRRVVIVDPIDDLERGAANALLKSLEEPRPGTFFLLVAHRPGRLLPTIRSRCRTLPFAPLGDAAVEAMLARAAPEADAATRAAAVAAAAGSPGVALGFVGQDLGRLHGMMLRLMHEGDERFELRGAFAEEIGARPDRERIAATLELARALVAAQLRESPRDRQLAIADVHAALVQLAGQAPTYNFDSRLLAMEIGHLLATLALPRAAA